MDNYYIFRSFIEQVFGKMPEKDWCLLDSILLPQSINKGDIILEIGARCKHLWFLINGAVRTYEIIEGRERSNYFFVDKSLFIDYYSIASNKPSELCFIAQEKSELFAINYSDLLTLYDQSQVLERIGRIMAERQFVIEYELRRMFINMDSLERYNYLLESNPSIFQRFPLKDIASFIGITPVSLSRLRKMK